jgi:phosphoenolpyruvate synthase/pyruvate phosphate dikinase
VEQTTRRTRARIGNAQICVRLFEGNKDLKDLLGGKGSNLAEMTRMGLPVPPGFTISTDACREYLRTGFVPAQVFDETAQHLRMVEQATCKSLGSRSRPFACLAAGPLAALSGEHPKNLAGTA